MVNNIRDSITIASHDIWQRGSVHDKNRAGQRGGSADQRALKKNSERLSALIPR